MAYTLITAATQEPVTLAEAKLHLNEDRSEKDTLITKLITRARRLAEHKTGRAFAPQTWELVLDAFPEAFMLLPAPITAITSVKYIDSAGVEQTLDPAGYQLDKDSAPGYLVPAYGTAWPAQRQQANAVRVRYTCGYAINDAQLDAVTQWMLLAIGVWYRHAEATTSESLNELPRTYVDGLLDEYKVYLA